MADWILQIVKTISGSSGNRNIFETKDEVITRLKFIGRIKPRQKVDCNNLSIESSSLFTSIKRLLNGDGRAVTLNFFNSTINRAIELIDIYTGSTEMTDHIACCNVVRDLTEAIKGLRAAQQTYSEDSWFVCSIDVILEKIATRIYKIHKTHPEIVTLMNRNSAGLLPLDENEEESSQSEPP